MSPALLRFEPVKMKIQYEVPVWGFGVHEERKTVKAMAESVKKSVVRNTRRGVDAHGRKMPPPKDKAEGGKGKAMIRSGRLVDHIAAVPGKARRKPRPSGKRSAVTYSVYSVGPRPDVENVKKKKARARERQKSMRAAAVIGEAFGTFATGRDLSEGFSRKKRGAGMTLSKIRVRAAATNQAVAAILSTPPKDLRSRNGNRKIYRVFESSPEYQLSAMSGALRAGIRTRIRRTGTKKGKLT